MSRTLLSIAVSALCLPSIGQTISQVEPLHSQIRPVDTPESRQSAVDVLKRARSSYMLRSAGAGYDIKVSFVVNSQGQTEYDGTWSMHDVFDPKLGLRWTAQVRGAAGSAYSIEHISTNGKTYESGSGDHIPLRLHEARAALFGAIPSATDVQRQSLRISSASFNGAELTCLLIAGPAMPKVQSSQRRAEETEECIDPQSGLLRVHSLAPGRFTVYDYSGALQFRGHTLPRRVTIIENGQLVSEISVESLTELSSLPSADPNLFTPTAAMIEHGRATALGSAQKMIRYINSSNAESAVTSVCVFGLVTPSGQLVDAHSLQPTDPNSQAAVEAARSSTFPHTAAEQHFVFILYRARGNSTNER